MRSWSDTRVLEPPPFAGECAGAVCGGQFPLGVATGESSLKLESRGLAEVTSRAAAAPGREDALMDRRV